MANRSTSISFDLLARDKTLSKTLGRAQKNTKSFMGSLTKLAGVVGIAFGARAVVNFAEDSVKAFAEAQKAQLKLSDAYSRFPAIADVNIAALRKWNEARAKTTRFDDDASAAAEAVLAQYQLTGKQILKLMPLVQDYAAKTGKALPDAAETLGKALLGQGRALKEIGIDFKDTGSVAGNFESIVASLSEQVGGFAEKDATSAEGKLEILRNRFGEVQEVIGEALMPFLDDLVTWLEGEGMVAIEGFVNDGLVPGLAAFKDTVDWVGQYKDQLGPAAAALGVLTTAQWLLNGAMYANPIGLVIAGLILLIGLITAVVTNFGGLGTAVSEAMFNVYGTVIKVARAVVGFFEGIVNLLIDGLNTSLSPINDIIRFFGGQGIKIGHVDFTSGMDQALVVNEFMRTTARAYFDGGEYNPSVGRPTSGGRSNVGLTGGSASKVQATRPVNTGMLASGGVVSSAMLAMIGEGPEPEVVAPLSKFPAIAAAAGIGGSGGTVIELHGDAGMLAELFEIWERHQDGRRVRVSKMGKQQ